MELEDEARREGASLAEILDRITTEWLRRRKNLRNGDEEEQARLQKRAETYFGSIASGNPELASRTSQRVKQILKERYVR